MRYLASALALGLVVVAGAIAVAGQGQTPRPSPQQTPVLKAGSAIILGKVVEAGTTTGVSGAIVTLSGPALGAASSMFSNGTAGGPRRVMTDAQGQFLFRDLPAGRYVLESTASGYVGGTYGQTPLPKRALDLVRALEVTDADKPLTVTMQMSRLGGISGRVTDEAGEPMVGAPITLLARFSDWGAPVTQVAARVTTDDRGIYHADVLPGDYVVGLLAATTTVPASAVDGFQQAVQKGGPAFNSYMDQVIASGSLLPRGVGVRVGNFLVSQFGMQNSWVVPPFQNQNGRVFFYPTTFHPSSVGAASASLVTLASGEEKAGIDLSLRPVPARRVSGKVVGPNGPIAGIALRLISPDADAGAGGAGISFIASDTSQALTDGNGDFTFLGVAPGSYTVRVLRASTPTEPVWWAADQVAVGAETDLTDLTVRLQAGAPIGGRLVVEGSGPPPPPAALLAIGIRPTPMPGSASSLMGPAGWIVHPDGNGRFMTGQMVPGPYMASITSLPSGWTLKSVTVGGQNAVDKPFELTSVGVTDLVVTISDRVSTLAGTARDANGQPEPTATVAVFPADKSLWPPPGMASRRIQTTAPGRDGRYSLRGLPAGEYVVVATDWPADFSDATVRSTLMADAVRVTINEGDNKSQDVRVLVKR